MHLKNSKLSSNFKKLFALSCLGILIAACSGGGSRGGGDIIPIIPVNPVNPVDPTDCFENPNPNTRLPSQHISTDDVFHNYTNPDSTYQIFGWANPNPIHVKKIKVFNNYSKTIYPVIYSPTPFQGSDGKEKTLSRIFVGKPACKDKTAFYAGIPAGKHASVYVPKQMWDAGHIKIFTEAPPFKQEDVNKTIEAPIYTVDTIKNSPNHGYLLYVSGTADDFPQELPFQLTEYTIEANCHDDADPSCATVASDRLTVDFDISAVDQLYIPVAMQESTGSRGYVGTNATVGDFQAQIRQFIDGTGEFSYDSTVGWPFYYGSNGADGYKNNLVKIPMGYNVINSILFPSPSPFGPVNSIFVHNKLTNQSVGDQTTLQNVANNLEPRWTKFWTPGTTVCNGRADQAFCTDFVKTMNFLFNNIVAACQYSLSHTVPAIDPLLCTTLREGPPLNPRSVLTDIDKIQKLLGYTFSGTTFDSPQLGPIPPTGPYLASDPDGLCQFEFPSVPPKDKDGTFYSNCFRDMAKSVQRGVPYPFWLYPTQFYPDLSSIYTLNPVVWLVHKKLNLSVYAFSVDDDIGNQELVGTGINVAVGGLTGLVSTNAFDPKFLQILAFPGGTTNVQWNGTVSSSSKVFPACIPGQVGACDVNIQEGGYTSVDVSLTGVANPNNFLKFTITSGTPKLCSSANPDFNPNNPGASADYLFTPLLTGNCSTSTNLQNCAANAPSVSFSSKTLNCAQTVEFAVPVPV